MRRLEKRDLAKYPFLKGAKAYVQGSGISIDSLIRAQSGKGEDLMKLAAARVKAALRPPSFDETNTDIKNADDEIYAYAIARLLASCMDDPSVLDKLARYEAERSAYYLKGEGPELTAYIARSVGIDMTTPDMGVKQYVELASRMRDPRWRLVNRDVIHGRVLCTPDDYTVILRERIRQVIRSQLPLTVPGPSPSVSAHMQMMSLMPIRNKSLSSTGRWMRAASLPAFARSLLQSPTGPTSHTRRALLWSHFCTPSGSMRPQSSRSLRGHLILTSHARCTRWNTSPGPAGQNIRRPGVRR